MRNYTVKLLCAILILVPVLAWIGWIFDIPTLRTVLPDITPMNPVTALCFFSLGVSLYLVREERSSKESRAISQVLAGFVCLIGLIMLLKYVVGIDFEIDRVYFTHKLGTNRLAPNTALNLVIAGLALLNIDTSLYQRRPAQYLAVLSLMLCSPVLVGYAYGVRSFYGIASYVPMALHSALCFIVFAFGILYARHERGGMRIITTSTIGGVISRLIIASSAISFGIGAIGIYYFHRGVYEFAMGIALIITVTIFLTTSLIWTIGLFLYKADCSQQEAQERLEKRTKELEARGNDILNKNKELEDSKLAVLNILEDLEGEKQKAENERVRDEALLESIGEGMVAIDTTGKVIKINQQAVQLLGWTIDQLLGSNWYEKVPVINSSNEFIPPEKRPTYQSLVLGKRIMDGNYLYVRKDHSTVPVYMTASPIILGGKTNGTILVFRDITHEREVDRAKSEFVSLASHQLRTPLSAISWYTEMLLAGDAGEITAEQRTYLDEVYRGNRRMVDLVNSLLNVSRIDLGTFSIEPEPTQVTEIATSVLKDLESQTTEKQQRVEVEFDEDIPLIDLDPKLTRMILQNLLSNAVKYTPEQGSVRLCITIESHPRKHLQILVADTGYGIPKNQKDKIFTKLFRADNVMERDTEGTGLGLYLVKAILDSTGGSISFKSREGRGTQFFVTIPMSGMQIREGNKGLS